MARNTPKSIVTIASSSNGGEELAKIAESSEAVAIEIKDVLNKATEGFNDRLSKLYEQSSLSKEDQDELRVTARNKFTQALQEASLVPEQKVTFANNEKLQESLTSIVDASEAKLEENNGIKVNQKAVTEATREALKAQKQEPIKEEEESTSRFRLGGSSSES